MSDNLTFGCIRFDNTHEHDTGWAAVAGERAYRISSTRDLQPDVVWHHNLPYEIANASGMSGHAVYRRNDYLSEVFLTEHKNEKNYKPEKDLSYEISALLGANPKDHAQQVMRMAGFFDRVMTVAKHFGVRGVPNEKLSSGLRGLFFSYDPVIQTDGLFKIISEAKVDNVIAQKITKHHGDVSRMALSIEKVSHGIQCANVRIPSGKWQEVKLPRNGEDSLDNWLINIGIYALIECSIENVAEDVHRLLNYGSGAKGKRWMTGIELILLNKFSKITVRKAYVPTDTLEIVALQPLFEQHDPIHELSLAMGFFWQNIWLGLCGSHRPPDFISKKKDSINTVAPFIKAIDRNACFLEAHHLQSKGIIINSYSKGKVHILHDGDNEKLAEACRGSNVIPPFLKTKIRDDVGHTPGAMFQEFYIQGDYEQLESADQQIVEMICKN